MSELENLSVENQTVTELSEHLRIGALDSKTIVETCLERIAQFDDKLHSFIAVYGDDSRQAAEAADLARKSGHSVGALHGIPIALKDIIDVEGRITTGGSKVWKDRVSKMSATLTERLINAGMIVIGKTHTVEFAMGGWGTNQHLGTSWNPWDLQTHRAPGGSSAGSGVSVGARLAPCAIGTDTGGSVRLPSAWCGLTGLKATIGRISTYGVLPLSTTLDTPGPMCRSVEDAARIFDVLQGPDSKDPKTLNLVRSDPFRNLRAGVRGLRIGRLPAAEREGVDSDILAAYDQSLDVFASLGAAIVDVDIPHAFNDLGAMIGNVIGAEGYAEVGDLVDDMSLPIDEDVRPRIWLGKGTSARKYIELLRQCEKVRQDYSSALIGVDALLTPTTATPAPVVDEIDQTGTPAGFTRVVNLLERCALTQPNGFTTAGLPIAQQIICDKYDEAMALRIGWAFEQATDWTTRMPPGL